uniref:PUM-HD domain-containing protein n=1 Tax=Parastrongyloides trichosuri TaxID=131310 RepID=A0A0N4Z310_PARTI
MEGVTKESANNLPDMIEPINDSSVNNNVEENGWEQVTQKVKKPVDVILRTATSNVSDGNSVKKISRTNNPISQNWRDTNNGFFERKPYRSSEKYFPGKSSIMQSEIDDNWRADSKKIDESNAAITINSTTMQQNSDNVDTSNAKETGLQNNNHNLNIECSFTDVKKMTNALTTDTTTNPLRDEKFKVSGCNEKFQSINHHSEFDPLNSNLDKIFHTNDGLDLDELSSSLVNANSVGYDNSVNSFDSLFQSLSIDNKKMSLEEQFPCDTVLSENDPVIPTKTIFDAFKETVDIPNDTMSQIPTQLTGGDNFSQQSSNRNNLISCDYSPVQMDSYMDTARINQLLNENRKSASNIMNIQSNLDINSQIVPNNLFNLPPMNVANNNPMQSWPEQVVSNYNPPTINGQNMYLNNTNYNVGLLNTGLATEKIFQNLFQMDAFSQLLQSHVWYASRENLRWICTNNNGDTKGPFLATELTSKFITFSIPPYMKFHCEQLPFKGWLTLIELIRAADDRIPFISANFPRSKEEYHIIKSIFKVVGETINSVKWMIFFQSEENKVVRQPHQNFDAHMASIVANLRQNPVIQKATHQLSNEQLRAYVNTQLLNQQFQKDKTKVGKSFSPIVEGFNQQAQNFDETNKNQAFPHNINFNPDLPMNNLNQDATGKQLYLQQRANYFQGVGKNCNPSTTTQEVTKVENSDTNQQQVNNNKVYNQKKNSGETKDQEMPTFHCGTWIPQNTKKKVSGNTYKKPEYSHHSNGGYQYTDYHGKSHVQRPTLLSSSKNWESPNIKPDNDTPAGKVPTGLSLGEFLAPATGQIIERPQPVNNYNNNHRFSNHWNDSHESHNNTYNKEQNTNNETSSLTPPSVTKLPTTSPITPHRPVGAVWKNENKGNSNSSAKGSSLSSKNGSSGSTFGAEEAAIELQHWLFEKFKTLKSESDVMAFCQFISDVDNPADIEDYFYTNFGDSVDVRKVYRQYLEKRNEIRSRVIKAKSGQDDLSAPAQAIGFSTPTVKKNKKKSG